MAKFAATDYKVTINGTNFSTNLNSVELALESDDLETTAFGGEFRTRIGGLKSGSITLQFMQDFAAASVDATLFPLFNTLATVVITPTSGTVNSSNPSYTAVALVNSYTPFASSVGDIATFSITLPTSGTVQRGTV
jgi:predicted secreted protein